MSARRARCAALAFGVLLSILVVRRSASAESTLVALAGSGSTSPSMAELLNRVRGELVADGFRVLLLDPVVESERVEVLTRAGQRAGAAIIAGFFVDDAEGIELCLVDALTSRVAVEPIGRPVGSVEEPPEMLARHSVDLLRARLLDFVVGSLKSAVAKPGLRPEATPPAAPSGDAPATLRVAVEGGLGVLGSFGGVGPAALPLLRARLAVNRALHLRVTGAWLGTEPVVTGQNGAARIEQGLAFVDATLRCCESQWIRPSVSLGAGLYYVGVTGEAAPPRQSTRSTTVSAAITGGLGVAVPVTSHFEAVLEADAIVAVPGIAVRFVDTDVAQLGRPALLGTLTLAGWI